MTSIRFIAIFVLYIADLFVQGARCQAPTNNAVLHGTIDVVVKTREGFVLATDSCGSDLQGNCMTRDIQKLFRFGTQTQVS